MIHFSRFKKNMLLYNYSLPVGRGKREIGETGNHFRLRLWNIFAVA